MAQDGSKRASENPRLPPIWPEILQDRSRWLPMCSKRPQEHSKTDPRGAGASQGGPQEANIFQKPTENQ